MTNSKQIFIAFVLLASAANGASFGGLSNITIFGNQDPKSCQLTLSLAVQEDKIEFTETVSDPNKICTLQNLQFTSAFRDDTVYGNITLDADKENKTFSGALTKDDLDKFNGTACGNLGDNGNGSFLYACRFRYGDIFFYLAVFVDEASLKFDVTFTDLIFPQFGNTLINATDNGISLLTANTTFPQIVGLLSQAATSTSSIITDIKKNIWVTGTDQASKVIDLHAILGDFQLDVIILRQKNGQDNQYIVFHPASQVLPFASEGKNGTIDTGITWNSLVGDFALCANGCDISMVLQKSNQIFVLQTSGATTTQKSLRA